MKDQQFELGSVGELRRKYGLVAANRPDIHLNAENVPQTLRHLIPYAELWGISDDLIRDDLVRSAPPEALEDLKRLVQRHDDLLDEWLAGPESEGGRLSAEYVAFTAMRMAADGV